MHIWIVTRSQTSKFLFHFGGSVVSSSKVLFSKNDFNIDPLFSRWTNVSCPNYNETNDPRWDGYFPWDDSSL